MYSHRTRQKLETGRLFVIIHTKHNNSCANRVRVLLMQETVMWQNESMFKKLFGGTCMFTDEQPGAKVALKPSDSQLKVLSLVTRVTGSPAVPEIFCLFV